MTAELAPAPAAEGTLVGHCIDERYRLEAVIGVGGLGSVYRATHTKLQKPVAVKLMHESFGESQVQRGRFAREAKALAALQHPNIVAVLDYGVSDARPYLVMELLEGETLSQRLQRGPLPVDRALQIIQQLLEALAFMHRSKLVHRDVKPSNVFLQRTRDGYDRVKVLDFGLAKFTAPSVSSDPTLTRDGAIVGTPAYMSPEQATGEDVDARSDVYTAGVIMFRVLSGRLPFEGDAFEQVRSHLIAPVPNLHRSQPDQELDPALEQLIRKAMAKRREDRFEDAGKMLHALVEAFPQFMLPTLPAHEPVPFSVDAANADWLLHTQPDEDEHPTLPRAPRAPTELTRFTVRGFGRAMRKLVLTSVRLFAGVSVLLVVGAGAIFVLLLRSDADRVELNALRKRVSERLMERSLRAGAQAEERPVEASVSAAKSQLAAAKLGSPKAAEPAAGLPEAVPGEVSGILAIATSDSAPQEQRSAVAEPAADLPPSFSGAGALRATPRAGVAPARALISRSFTAAPPGMLPGSAPAPQPSAATPPGMLPASGSAAAAAYLMSARAGAPAPQPVAAAVAARAEPEAPASPRDPWLQPIPERLRRARKIAQSGGRGSEAMIDALREYNKENADDPRGHLLLGQLYLNRFWRADALSQLSIAMALDPNARAAPEVLTSLLALIVHGQVSADAERTVVSRFGSEALPAIDRTLASLKDKDPKAASRLSSLRTRCAAAKR
ncbi:MAG TPA: protein kinase [Polyangiales bacterium]|nr:protein kinase [Polyangiales bacterium]